MSRVSVIMPTYNRAGYITKTLESIFAQTFKDYEVIVVDDGSTDKTEEVLRPHLDRITFIRKENGGPGSARNAGIKVAKGEYIAFLDSDDLWLPEKLNGQVKYLDDYPDVGLLFTDFEIFCEDENGQERKLREIHINVEGPCFDKLFQKNFIPTLTVIIRKSCMDAVGLFEESRDLVVGEDYELWLRMAMRYRLGYIPKITARYRCHNDNIVGTDLAKNYAGHLRVINKILVRYPEIPKRFNIDMEEYYRNFFYCAGRNLYQNKMYRPAVQYLRQALSYKLFAPKAWTLYFLGIIRSMSHGQTG